MKRRGWPKGKPQGPATPAQLAARKKLAVAGMRAHKRRKIRAAEMSSGLSLGGGLNDNFNPGRAHVATSSAVWLPAQHHVGDYQYIDDGLDDIFFRALEQRVIYGHSVTSHRAPALQDLTIKVIAEVEAYGQKMDKKGPDPRKPSLPLPRKTTMSKLPLTERQLRLIGLLAAGMSTTEIGHKLGMKERTVKMHCDVLRAKFSVGHRREIPLAYRKKTGKDPFALIPEFAFATPLEREGPALTAVVEEMFKPAVGTPLLEVVSQLFDTP